MSTLGDAIVAIIGPHEMDAVEIAFSAKRPVDVINAELRDLIAAGVLLKEKVPGESGSRAYTFSANPEFRAPEQASDASQIGAPPVLDQLPAIKKTIAIAEGTTMTKVDKALAFLRTNSPATSAQLHAAMGLPAMYSPSQYLGTQIKRGEIERAGDVWRLPGSRDKASASPAPNPVELPAPTAGIEVSVTDPIRTVAEEQKRQRDQITARIELGGLQITHSNNGDLVITKNGQPMKLIYRDTQVLSQFLKLIDDDFPF